MGLHSQLRNPLQYCSRAKFKFRALRRLHHSRKPIATRFQQLTATHATDVGDFVTTVTQRVTVAVELKFRVRHRLRHSRKPIAARSQHQTATHATDVSDLVTTVTQRLTVALPN